MTPTVCAHQVQFYAADDALSTNVYSFLAVPLLRGEGVVVVATPEHRQEFAAQLAATGVDVDAVRHEGNYLELDARGTLAKFMTDSGPDRARFRAVLGEAVTEITDRFQAVSAYGEMVGLLAAEGQLLSALQLEDLWSDLMTELSFRLLCGYPREAFQGPTGVRDLQGVRLAHDMVAPIAALSAAFDLPLGPAAGAAARLAVRDVCEAWGLHDDDWNDDVLLVTGELVSNAVRHASSRIALSLDAYGDVVTVSVTDGCEAVPIPRTPSQLAEDGRGFMILDALADRWGVERQPRGKRVWAQIRPCRRVPAG